MRMSAVAVLMILTTVFLSGCGTQQTAAVDDHRSAYYGRNGAGGTHASYADGNTYQDAAVMGVATADLPAPTGGASPGMSSSGASLHAAPVSLAHATYNHAAYNGSASDNPALTSRAGTPFAHAKASDLIAARIISAAAPITGGGASAGGAVNWQWPVQGKILESFGPQGNAHAGITIAAAEGTPIHAAMAGEVAFVGSNVPNYGNMVILRHPNGDMTSYSYARKIVVTKGQQVAAGTVLGYVGQTGAAKSPQLHFALREGNHAVDPLEKLPSPTANG
jgi:murein DD-endopeptidase MepM/ murein hydrolase activator NlpD